MTDFTALFSSETDLWSTPQEFYDTLNAEFRFTLDPCSDGTNNKTEAFFTIEQDGLAQDWGKHTVFMNPPYGRTVGDWMCKPYTSAQAGATVVCLVPARTDTRWFHDWVYGRAELRFVKGRLKFGGQVNSAPFPSLVVIYRPNDAD